MSEKLSEADRNAAVAELRGSGWVLVEGRDEIEKTFQFKNFVQAFRWMT